MKLLVTFVIYNIYLFKKCYFYITAVIIGLEIIINDFEIFMNKR